jgi:hypothetical protein
MFHVKKEKLLNEHVRKMFYGIPRVGNMIAAHQLDFLGKTIRGPHDCPAQQMLTACCNNVHQVGHPFLHNKDYIVKNLRLFFANVPEVTINDYGSLKHWIREASIRSAKQDDNYGASNIVLPCLGSWVIFHLVKDVEIMFKSSI